MLSLEGILLFKLTALYWANNFFHTLSAILSLLSDVCILSINVRHRTLTCHLCTSLISIFHFVIQERLVLSCAASLLSSNPRLVLCPAHLLSHYLLFGSHLLASLLELFMSYLIHDFKILCNIARNKSIVILKMHPVPGLQLMISFSWLKWVKTLEIFIIPIVIHIPTSPT